MAELPARAWSVKRLAEAWDCPVSEIDGHIDAGRLAAFSLGPKTWRITPIEAERAARVRAEGLHPDAWPVVAMPRTPDMCAPKPAREIKPPLVYFVNCGAYTKIGFTSQDLEFRVKAMMTANPLDFVIWAVIPGSLETEHELHAKFRDYHHRGEWFQFDAAGRLDVIRAVKSRRGRILQRGVARGAN